MKCLLVLLIALVLSSSSLADPVARVHKLYGQKNLAIKKSETGQWYRAHLEQDAEVGHRFKTDAETMANLQFFLGGYASLGKDCEVKLISEKDIGIISQGIKLEKGNFWAKFDKQKEAPIRIQTAGGVMGIKGTEFVVQVLEDGSTKLSLIEGEVAVTSAQGDTFSAQPGHEVIFGPNQPMLHRLYELTELRERIEQDLGPAFMELRNSMRELRTSLRESRVQVRAAQVEVRNSMVELRTLGLVGPLEARRAKEAEVLQSGAAREGLDQGLESLRNLDALLEKFEEKGSPPSTKPEEPSLAELPSAAVAVNATEHPAVRWEMKEAAPQYAVLFLHATDDDKVFWVGETSEKIYSHPKDAEPLPPGDYRFWVIPLDSEGQTLGDGLEGRFSVTG